MTDSEISGDCLSDSPVAGSIAVSEGLYRPAGPHNRPLQVERFERVIAAMSRRLDRPMTNAKMADIACLSPSHFNRLFRCATGIPPIHFHYALRLDFAKRLLVDTDLSITDICFEVGYNSLGTFVSRFSQLVGLSPSAFRSLTREFAKIRLSDLSALLATDVDEWSPAKTICGTISEPTDGIVFTALFPRAIPAGVPLACSVSSGAGAYGLPNPGNGNWYVFAVSVPRAATGVQLITLDGLRRVDRRTPVGEPRKIVDEPSHRALHLGEGARHHDQAAEGQAAAEIGRRGHPAAWKLTCADKAHSTPTKAAIWSRE